MSHLADCIILYRDDPLVSNEQYGRMVEDAHERDLDAEARGEAPEPEPADADLSIDRSPGWQGRSLTAAPPPGPHADAETIATYVLTVIAGLTETVEQLANGIGLLNDLDTKRGGQLAEIERALLFTKRRLDLRAEEADALGKRIENLTRLVSARSVRPA